MHIHSKISKHVPFKHQKSNPNIFELCFFFPVIITHGPPPPRFPASNHYLPMVQGPAYFEKVIPEGCGPWSVRRVERVRVETRGNFHGFPRKNRRLVNNNNNNTWKTPKQVHFNQTTPKCNFMSFLFMCFVSSWNMDWVKKQTKKCGFQLCCKEEFNNSISSINMNLLHFLPTAIYPPW